MLLIHIVEILVLAIYFLSLLAIVFYSLGQLHLVLTFLRFRKKAIPEPPLDSQSELPFVTVQLPVYNELYVVERLLESIAAMDYPADRFEIQLLDDSDDESFELAAKKVAELRQRGLDVVQIRRPNREGFKAGALAYGMEIAKGNFLAIFDADFMPRPGYLREALANFTDPNIGVVQARWEHINRSYSIFTEAQAFHLDAHFTIEQFSRDHGGFYINFNGTAGVWRKECIIDAGGWKSDTLTEDLDLSYRAQICGWQFRYIDEIGTPAELPAEMGAIKTQQYRWMKGGAEVARKMLRKLWQSPAPLIRKFHGTLHLLSSSVFLVVFLITASSVPLMLIKHHLFGGSMDMFVIPITALNVSFLILASVYAVTFGRRERSFAAAVKRFTIYYLPFLALSIGLSLHNSLAVLQGWFGKKTPFIRTPKFDLHTRKDSFSGRKYISRKINPAAFAEILMAFYFLGGIGLSVYFKDFGLLPFLLLAAVGYGAVGVQGVRHAYKK